jgi:hypothetical protein
MAGGIVMLEGDVRMSLQEGYHMRERPWASFIWCFSESVERPLECPKFSKLT